MLNQNIVSSHDYGEPLPFPTQGKLRAGYLKGLNNFILSSGGNPSELLKREGIDPSVFDDPDYEIECLVAVNLLEHCSITLGDPLFGLRLAEYQDPDVLGCAMALASAAPNLRQAIECFIDYVPITTSPECELELVKSGNNVELRYKTNIGIGDKQQVYFHGLQLIMKALQMFGHQFFKPSYATLCFDVDRAGIRALEEKMRCKVYGKREVNAIAFPAELLDRPLPTANKILFSLLKNSMVDLRSSAKANFVEQVEANVRRMLSSGTCSLELCAEQLCTTTRTLQKRLARAGLKFSNIVQEERIKLAKHALLWSDYSLIEIAFQLGYSEPTSFGRAFKKSTGLTPKEFRKVGRAKH